MEANAHVSSSQGNPLARAHFRILGVLQPAEKAQRHPMNPMSGASLLSKILSEKFEKFRLCVSSYTQSQSKLFESKEAPLIGFMMCLCAFSASWETPKILKWARASGFPWD